MSAPFQKCDNDSFEALRRRLQAEMRLIHRTDIDGVTHAMVWIPHFRVPAESFGQSTARWPPAKLNLGGFFVDQYACHDMQNFMPVSAKAVSGPGYLPLVSIDHGAAVSLAELRTFYSEGDCRLPTLQQWQTLALIPALVGHSIRGVAGNTGAALDSRDEDVAENRGVQSGQMILAGTGPSTYSLTGGPNAPFDVLGNVSEWNQGEVPACRLTVIKSASIADAGGISSGDPSVVIGGIQDIALWPASGVVRCETEAIAYATFADNGDGTATLGGLTRGHRGTTAAIHADGIAIFLVKDFCILPGGSTGFVTGCNNTTTPVAITFHDRVAHPDAPAFAAGQTIVVATESMVVTSVAGDVLTVTRAAPVAHADWTACVQAPADFMSGLDYVAFPRSWRSDDPDITPLGLPLHVQGAYAGAECGDEFRVTSVASLDLVVARGGNWNTAVGGAQHGWAWWVRANTADSRVGMRCVWTPA